MCKEKMQSINNLFKMLIVAICVMAVSLIFPKNTSASEGTIELRGTGVEPYRCYATSIRMLEPEYRILFTCKFILYPAEEDVFNYAVWASPIEGTKPVRLGFIGQGRGEFKTKIQFSSLFVTTEPTKEVKTPTGRVVMKGNVEPITFLEEVKEYEPTPTLSDEKRTNLTPTVTGQQETATVSTKDKILTAFKRAGVAAVVAIIALVGLIFVITRSRG